MIQRKKSYYPYNDDDPVINLTPLIDVVFVVLIMFIVVAPILELDKVMLAQGGEQTTSLPAHTNAPLTIHVHADNSIWINKRQIVYHNLEHTLRTEKKRYQCNNVHLFHDKRAAFGTYQSIKNTVELVGFDEMDVIVKP